MFLEHRNKVKTYSTALKYGFNFFKGKRIEGIKPLTFRITTTENIGSQIDTAITVKPSRSF